MFKTDLVEMSFRDERRAVWTFAVKRCKGTEFFYEVDDYNYYTRNHWQFVVQVPDDWTKGNYINVKPMIIPNRNAWASLDRRSISFQRATIGRHRGKVYAKLAIADIKNEKTKLILNKDNKPSMPKWLEEFSPVQKQRVTTSSANDGEQLVAVLGRDDHLGMIQLFLACKAWVLDCDYDPGEARKSALRRRQLAKRARLDNSLIGKVIAVTGYLDYGDRVTVYAWLEELGAKISHSHVTSKTDLLIEGAHHFGDDRRKIQEAEKLGVPRYTEARFRKEFVHHSHSR
jgi:NAD-dependent DNA ligase